MASSVGGLEELFSFLFEKRTLLFRSDPRISNSLLSRCAKCCILLVDLKTEL
jgi:hypothetical protein